MHVYLQIFTMHISFFARFMKYEDLNKTGTGKLLADEQKKQRAIPDDAPDE